jgi:nitroreductase
MKKAEIKKVILLAALLPLVLSMTAIGQDLQTVKLNEPNKKRGLPVMEALSVKASATEWSDRELSPQDLADLLWAANGVNRPESGKRTASSAMNAQDVDIYVFMKAGVFLYDAKEHALVPVAQGDLRSEIIPARPAAGGPGGPPAKPGEKPVEKPQGPPPGAPAAKPGAPQTPSAPVLLVLVSDVSRFRAGSPEMKLEWGAIDTGIVSQNISLFCAATGLATRPRASMDRDKIRSLLKLKETQYPMLNHPVGYKK